MHKLGLVPTICMHMATDAPPLPSFNLSRCRLIARAATIAVRYLAVRRQFQLSPAGDAETQVLDYRAVQQRVLPQLATTFALHFTGKHMQRLHAHHQAHPNPELLQEVHATSAGLKSLCTQLTASGIETLRLACGGHGYSAFSGLPEAYTNYVAQCTAEGDNYLLKIQTTRYLLKALHKASTGAGLPSNLAYLAEDGQVTDPPPPPALLGEEISFTMAMLAIRARRIVTTLAGNMQACLGQGVALPEAFNRHGWEVVRASDAHCQLVIAQSFHRELLHLTDRGDVQGTIVTVLQQLLLLFATSTVMEGLGEHGTQMWIISMMALWLGCWSPAWPKCELA
eukprot:m.367822 g.367822  ORF g.367822 m.367822 type:complete len:339 (-) comp19975_c1_seq64:3324-4340(-)